MVDVSETVDRRVVIGTVHGALHSAAGYPADNFTVSGVQAGCFFRGVVLHLRKYFNKDVEHWNGRKESNQHGSKEEK